MRFTFHFPDTLTFFVQLIISKKLMVVFGLYWVEHHGACLYDGIMALSIAVCWHISLPVAVPPTAVIATLISFSRTVQTG